MKNSRWIVGATAVSLMIGAPTLAQSQEAPKETRPARIAQAATEKAPKLNARTRAMLEAIFGTTFTQQQQDQIAIAAAERTAAQRAIETEYRRKVASALGTTLEDFDAREKAYRDKQRADREAQRAAEPAAAEN